MAPLSGIRVVEIGQVFAGAFAGAVLADLGEKPEGGDDARQMGRAFRRGDALNFHKFNRGKKSVALDLESAAVGMLVTPPREGYRAVATPVRPSGRIRGVVPEARLRRDGPLEVWRAARVETYARRRQATSSSSTSKTSVALGGITLPAPRAP